MGSKVVGTLRRSTALLEMSFILIQRRLRVTDRRAGLSHLGPEGLASLCALCQSAADATI